MELAAYRKSDQREAIVEAIKKLGGHSTADQVYETVKRSHPRISLGTVYRNLRVLCEQGAIREVKSGQAIGRFELASPRHYHLICRQCGNIEDCTMPVDRSLDEKVQRTTDFKIEQHRLDFIGVCAKCRRTAEGS